MCIRDNVEADPVVDDIEDDLVRLDAHAHLGPPRLGVGGDIAQALAGRAVDEPLVHRVECLRQPLGHRDLDVDATRAQRRSQICLLYTSRCV